MPKYTHTKRLHAPYKDSFLSGKIFFRIDGGDADGVAVVASLFYDKDDKEIEGIQKANADLFYAAPELLRELLFWRNVANNLLTDSQLDAVMKKHKITGIRNTPRNRCVQTDIAIAKAMGTYKAIPIKL